MFLGYSKGYNRYGKKNNRLAKKAIKLANKSDIIVYAMGLDEVTEAEGIDRPNINISKNQIDLLKKSYLVKGRDEHFLMNNYINSSGYRYAEDLTYEAKLKQTYNTIKKNTKIQ